MAPTVSAAADRRSSLVFLVWIALGIAFSRLLPLSGGDTVATFLWGSSPDAGAASNGGNYAGRIIIGLAFIAWACHFEHHQGWLLLICAVVSAQLKVGLALAYHQDLFDPYLMVGVCSFFNGAIREFSEHYGLSPREQDVLELLLQGCTRAQVGTKTGLADGTVRTHVTNIHKKLGVHTREELAACFERSTKQSAEND